MPTYFINEIGRVDFASLAPAGQSCGLSKTMKTYFTYGYDWHASFSLHLAVATYTKEAAGAGESGGELILENQIFDGASLFRVEKGAFGG